MKSYDHLVKIDEGKRLLTIYRSFQDGTLELFTSVNLPDTSSDDNTDSSDSFAKLLGENLLMDSPVARKLLRL